MTNRMTNAEAREELKYIKKSFAQNKLSYEALDIAIKAVERIGHLIDRPCEACEYHKETGCSQWSCVFEEVKDDES